MKLTASFDVYPSVWDNQLGMYVWMNPNSASSHMLMGFIRNAPFKTFNTQEMHCTVMHCSKDVQLPDYRNLNLPEDGLRDAEAYHITHWVDHKNRNILVLELMSDDLQELHKDLAKSGFVHSFKGGYNPHITIAKDVDMNAETRMWLEKKNKYLENNPIYIEFNLEIFVTSQE